MGKLAHRNFSFIAKYRIVPKQRSVGIPKVPRERIVAGGRQQRYDEQ